MKHDFTSLVNTALKECPTYRKLDWAQLRADEIAIYDVGEEAVDILMDTPGTDIESHITNLEEVKANEERTKNEYQEHLRSCEKPCCKSLFEARVDIGAMKRDE